MTIEDPDLGEIKLVANAKARRIIVRRKEDGLHLTYPPSVSLSYIKATIEEMKSRLLRLKEQARQIFLFVPEVEFSSLAFSLKIYVDASTSNYYSRLKDGVLFVSCPSQTDFESTDVQQTIRGIVEKYLRAEAKRLFPIRVGELAQANDFTFSEVKINKSRTRWGSCTSRKGINLSYFCMLLPKHLADFVILHELCHTQEMNHGERFWQLLDKVSGGNAKSLTKELKSYKISW